MKVLHTYDNYTTWMRDEFLVDILTNEEIIKFTEEEKPDEFPCLVVFNDSACNYKVTYITLHDIQKWQELLLSPSF